MADQRARVPDDIPANQQPAMFLIKPKEVWNQTSGDFTMTTYRLQYFLLVSTRAAGTPEDSGSTAENILDNILDAIDTALQSPRKGEPQTLGGLVTNCWVEGQVDIDTPVLFEQCAIWLPITVVVGM